MFPDLAKRHLRRRLLLEVNPYQVLAAEVSRPSRGVAMLDAAAEFDRDDTAGLNRWIESRGLTQAICGLVPRRGIVQRESVHPRRMAEPSYLSNVIEEQQRGRFLSATPFKLLEPALWTLRAVNAVDGSLLAADGPPQAALIGGIANEEIEEVQQRLFDEGLTADRMESGLLSLFGAVYGQIEGRGDSRAVAVVVIHQGATAVYILGKEGVHTPNPIFHGMNSIVELARKELGLKEDHEVRTHIDNADPLLQKYADKLVRRIGRDLKPVLDSYEMTTGQPVDEIFCPYLPLKYSWIAEPLAHATGRAHLVVDCDAWLPTARVQVTESGRSFGPHWLGALSLISHLPELAGTKGERPGAEDPTYQRSWHVDYRLAAMSAERKAAGRRFLAGVVAMALAIFTAAVTCWQLYATHSLHTDLQYWERQMADHQKLFNDLTSATSRLQQQSLALRKAHDLMAVPYQPSEFILNVGRTVPAHMRIDKIETNDVRAAISGALLQPAEEATATLGRYMEELRRNPAIGPLFASISITSLQRKSNGEAVVFEITLRSHPQS